MTILKLNCNYTCWQCDKPCEMKTFMESVSEADFNEQIIRNLKSNAGIRILNGVSIKDANEFVMYEAVALHIARKKYLETL